MSLVSRPGRSMIQMWPAASLRAQPFGAHRVGDQVRDADPGGAAAEDHDLLIGQPAARDAHTGQHARQADRRRALDVVVEGAQRVAVALEDARA